MTPSQILGFVGTGLVVTGYVPQIVHLIKERCTAGISIPAFSLWCAASLLFLIHAVEIRDIVFVGVQTVISRQAGSSCGSAGATTARSARFIARRILPARWLTACAESRRVTAAESTSFVMIFRRRSSVRRRSTIRSAATLVGMSKSRATLKTFRNRP